MFVMVNTKKFPREYGHGRANYINGPRVAGARSLPAKLDQVISCGTRRRPSTGRAPDPGLMLPDSKMVKQRASSSTSRDQERQATIWFFQDHQWKQRHDPSYKRQATSTKHHAPIFRKQQASIKLQAASVKLSNQPVQSPSDKHPIQNNKRQASSPE